MKLQKLNHSLAKTFAALAITFMISSAASAQAQQGQWGSDGCFYAANPGYRQLVRQGCNVRNTDGRVFYHDDRTQAFHDPTSGTWFRIGQYGRAEVLTNRGRWEDTSVLRTYQTAPTVKPIDPDCLPGHGYACIGGSQPPTDMYGRPVSDKIMEQLAPLNRANALRALCQMNDCTYVVGR